MLLTAEVKKAELVALLDSLTPLRLAFDGARGRSLTIGRPLLSLVPGRGIRLRGSARLSWETLGITVPVTLQGWQVLLVPKVVARGAARSLVLEPVIEELGLKLVPAFVADKITDTIGDWIPRYHEKLAWTFSRTLSRRWLLSPRITPHEAFELEAMAGEVTVTEEELRFTVRFEARVSRRAVARPAEAAPAKATPRPSAGRTGSPAYKPRPRPSSRRAPA
jgi:hypothetical protein